MTDLVVDRLRIRGPRARRLAQVAARHLPAALEAALADIDDLTLGTLAVRLDLDPADYDGETLAVLWAAAIRTEVLAAGGRTSRPAAHCPAPTPAVARRGAMSHPVAEIATVAQAWLGHASDAGSPPPALPPAMLSLTDPAVADAVASALGRDRWTQLLARMALALGLNRGRPDGVPPSPRNGHRGSGTTDGDPVSGGSPQPKDSGSDPSDGPDRPARSDAQPGAEGDAAHARAVEVARRLEVVAELTAGREDHDLAALTQVAGLVLLWPWLADLCREAERLHPNSTPHLVRASALALLADPDRPELVADPFVRLLAGVPEGRDVDSTRDPLRGLAEPADLTLRDFAGLLPGFGTSSPRFVRDQWVLRLGLVDASATPAALVAATHPLDVLLTALPYPVTLFKLPWSALVSVRFRP